MPAIVHFLLGPVDGEETERNTDAVFPMKVVDLEPVC
jgi:hypothetical protein